MIHERFLSEWGARHAMFEKFNGTPLWVIKLLTMQRVEYAADGPLTELARRGLRARGRKRPGPARRRGEGRLPVDSGAPDYVRLQDVGSTRDPTQVV